MHSESVLAEDGADERVEPASLTKMMTSYVVFSEMARGKFKLADQVLVSEKAWRMKGSRMFIEVGTRFRSKPFSWASSCNRETTPRLRSPSSWLETRARSPI
jgi:D-alanyl-D-alanine carboxypeptidase